MNIVFVVVHRPAAVSFREGLAIEGSVEYVAVDPGVSEPLVDNILRNVVQPDPGRPSSKTISSGFVTPRKFLRMSN